MFQVIVSRNYRGDVDMSCIEKFMPLLVEKEDEGVASPIIQVVVYYFNISFFYRILTLTNFEITKIVWW